MTLAEPAAAVVNAAKSAVAEAAAAQGYLPPKAWAGLLQGVSYLAVELPPSPAEVRAVLKRPVDLDLAAGEDPSAVCPS